MNEAERYRSIMDMCVKGSKYVTYDDESFIPLEQLSEPCKKLLTYEEFLKSCEPKEVEDY
jgi:hypothetical protein